MQRLILGMSLVSVLAACRDDSPAEPVPVPPVPVPLHTENLAHSFSLIPEAVDPTKEIPPNTPAVVELLTPGADPRAPLRWRFRPTSFVAHNEYREDFFRGDEFNFGMTVTASVRVEVIMDGSTPTARSTVLAHTLVTRGDVPETLRKAAAELVGATNSRALAALGDDFTLSPEMLTLRDTDPVRVATLNTAALWAPLPEDAIGVGARWAVDSTGLRSEGRVKSHSAHVYELETIQGARGRIAGGMLSKNNRTTGSRGFNRRVAWRQDFDLDNPLHFAIAGQGTSLEFGTPEADRGEGMRSEFSWRGHTTADTDTRSQDVTP